MIVPTMPERRIVFQYIVMLPQPRDDAVDLGLDDLDTSGYRMTRDDLGKAEGSDHRRDEGDAASEVGAAEGEARVGVDALHADHGDEEPDKARDPALDRVLGRREVAADDDAEDREPEELEALELQGHVSR